MIGVDTPSTDFGQSTTYDVHRIAGQANVIGLENVNNLDKIPPNGSTIFVGVINLYDGSGGPVRILAVTGNSRVPACICPRCSNNGGNEMLIGVISSLLVIILLFHRLVN